MFRPRLVSSWLPMGVIGLGGTLAFSTPAMALPAFAIQTSQPCQSCHVGGFGPQLTAFGRDFKLRGYTARSADSAPISAMAVASYLRTLRDQEEPPAPGYSRNDNATLDEASLFFAGGFGEHLGAFVQGTYDAPAHHWAWDNVDLRATTTATIAGADTVLGLSLNNSPTVQDAWGALPVWGVPYTDSGLAPGPAAATLISDALAQNVLGLTAYGWWNSRVYSEVGLYWSPSASFLDSVGVDPTDTSEIRNTAPYFRLAYQQQVAGGDLELGAFGLFADLYPGRDSSEGVDRYHDLGVDASYQMTTANGGVWSADARYIHEQQRLRASAALGDAANANNTLNELRADASYYWSNRVGVTVGLFDTWGSDDSGLYADSRTFSPDSGGVLLQIDHTPFGAGDSPLGPRFNARVGAQLIHYTKFDGASSNYDGAGRDASDNDSLRLFLWVAY